jgi:hypothetical protein
MSVRRRRPVVSLGTADYALLDPTDQLSFATCQARTNYTDRIEPKSLRRGVRLCGRTTLGNLVGLEVTSPDPADFAYAPFTFSVTVWKG